MAISVLVVGLAIGGTCGYVARSAEFNTLCSQIVTLQSQVSGLQAENSKLRANITALQTQMQLLLNENARLRGQIGQHVLGGQNAMIGEFNITVGEARWAKTLNGFNSSYENGTFLLVSLSVQNVGMPQRLFGIIGEYFGAIGTAEVAVIDNRGYEYPSFSKVPRRNSVIVWTVLPQMVNPRITMELVLAFDIPADAQVLRLGLRASRADEWTVLQLVVK